MGSLKHFWMTVFLTFSKFFIDFVHSEDEFHSFMSLAERREIFGSHDVSVSDYQLIQIGHTITKRGIYLNNGISIDVFGKIVNLTIQRRMPIFSTETPIWIASGIKDTEQVSFNRLNEDILKSAVQFYEDPENMAGIGIVQDEFGKIHFTIHHARNNYTIQKVPEALYKKWQELFRKSNNTRVKRSTEVPIVEDHYMVIKRSTINNDENLKKIKIHESALPPYHGPAKISPGILIIANYQTHYGSVMELHFYQLLVYLVCFWNAVNLNFNNFNEPKIDFHIAGIIVGNNQWAAPYLNAAPNPHKDLTLAEWSLVRFSKFLKNFDNVFNSWDIAVSQSDITIPSEKNRSIVTGISFGNQSCDKNLDGEYSKVALVLDKFNFYGTQIAAHEIGHIFGAYHDGSGNSKCENDGFLMSPTDSEFFYENSNFWSSCSIKEIMTELRRHDQRTCWRTRPSTLVEPIPEILPGYIVNFSDQCRARGYAGSCNEELVTCERLYCTREDTDDDGNVQSQHSWWRRALMDLILYSWWSDCKYAGVPHSGTICGVNKHCKLNKCVEITSLKTH